MLRRSLCIAIFCLGPLLLLVALYADAAGDTGREPIGSVFTVQRNGTVQPECKKRRPNDQSFAVATVEFNDDGAFAKAGQLDAALSCITNARRQNRNGVLVVLFIHGWHHNAAWNTQTNEGDAHFSEFRRILMSLALREAERYAPKGAGGRRVVGIYFGWNGDPEAGPSWPSFQKRSRVAVDIAKSTEIRQALTSIIDATKRRLASTRTHEESPLIMIGHSMGGLILETAFATLLRQDRHKFGGAVMADTSSSCSLVETEDRPAPAKFPDLVLLLNSAADSEVTADIADQIEQKQIRKVVGCGPSRYPAPLIISATSEGDWVTGFPFWFATFGGRTAANIPEMLTHRLVGGQTGAICTPKPSDHLMVDYGQSWHCLREPDIDVGTLTRATIDLPQAAAPRHPCHVRYNLEPIYAVYRRSPYWIFQVPSSIIKNHNDIFNAQSRLLIMGLMQLSGALMSLASDWPATFEAEEDTCALRPQTGAPHGLRR